LYHGENAGNKKKNNCVLERLKKPKGNFYAVFLVKEKSVLNTRISYNWENHSIPKSLAPEKRRLIFL